jgi:hypothetical protein
VKKLGLFLPKNRNMMAYYPKPEPTRQRLLKFVAR